MSNEIYPSQCECGHIYLEKFAFAKPNAHGETGLCWCGFCQTALMIPTMRRAQKKVEAGATGAEAGGHSNAQQLKADIAALADQIEYSQQRLIAVDIVAIVAKLRQLSAV